MERGALNWKPNIVEISPNCPRCGSSNTKFCYYNNYSLTQPRYFCKACRRYWTKGGSLRNIPVGGGCRKNRRANNNNKSLRHKNNAATFGNDHCKGISIDVPSTSAINTSSSIVPEGNSHIDLALVYANFLNPHHHSSKNISNSDLEPSNHVHQLPEFSSHHHLSNLDQPPLTVEQDQTFMYFCGLIDSSSRTNKHDHDKITGSNFCGLPPLPGEEMLWSNKNNSEIMAAALGDHHQACAEKTMFGSEYIQDPNLLFGSWPSPFDLSSTDDDTFSKT